MAPGGGIPGWFTAAIILVVLLGVGGAIWRVYIARRMAEDAGLDPNKATAAALLGHDGVDATYLASTLASRPPLQPTHPHQATNTVEQRLRELEALKDKGLITDDEYQSQRQKILGSI
jgi:Short C-terminal domain